MHYCTRKCSGMHPHKRKLELRQAKAWFLLKQYTRKLSILNVTLQIGSVQYIPVTGSSP